MRSDPQRLAMLKQCMLQDAAPQRIYDDLARALADGLQVPISMVNLLDADCDRFKAVVGLPITESPAATSFCEVFFLSDQDLIVVPDTALDARFAQHPLVVGAPHVRFYAAARLAVGGQTFGTLCAYDMRPRVLTAEQLGQLQALASAAVQRLSQGLSALPRA